MNPAGLKTIMARIDSASEGDYTDIDPRMIPTNPEAIADCKAFVMRNAARFKTNVWVTPMSQGRIQLEFARNGRDLEIEFDGKGNVVTLAYCKEKAGKGVGAEALMDWLNQGETSE
jgi:hypothetical protein